jgi:hypothetical protein
VLAGVVVEEAGRAEEGGGAGGSDHGWGSIAERTILASRPVCLSAGE